MVWLSIQIHWVSSDFLKCWLFIKKLAVNYLKTTSLDFWAFSKSSLKIKLEKSLVLDLVVYSDSPALVIKEFARFLALTGFK